MNRGGGFLAYPYYLTLSGWVWAGLASANPNSHPALFYSADTLLQRDLFWELIFRDIYAGDVHDFAREHSIDVLVPHLQTMFSHNDRLVVEGLDFVDEDGEG